jgi:hypothetical protein
MRGGSFSEAISCEAEGSRAKEPTLKKNLGDGKTATTSAVPTREHHFSDLKTWFSYLYPSLPKNMVFLSVPKFSCVGNELQHHLLATLIWIKPFRATRWAATS